jgi:hypothetical protein
VKKLMSTARKKIGKERKKREKEKEQEEVS